MHPSQATEEKYKLQSSLEKTSSEVDQATVQSTWVYGDGSRESCREGGSRSRDIAGLQKASKGWIIVPLSQLRVEVWL